MNDAQRITELEAKVSKLSEENKMLLEYVKSLSTKMASMEQELSKVYSVLYPTKNQNNSDLTNDTIFKNR